MVFICFLRALRVLRGVNLYLFHENLLNHEEREVHEVLFIYDFILFVSFVVKTRSINYILIKVINTVKKLSAISNSFKQIAFWLQPQASGLQSQASQLKATDRFKATKAARRQESYYRFLVVNLFLPANCNHCQNAHAQQDQSGRLGNTNNNVCTCSISSQGRISSLVHAVL